MLRHSFRAAAVTALTVFAATTQAQTSSSSPNIYGMLPLTTPQQQSSTSPYNPVTGGSPTNGAGAMSGSNNPTIQHLTHKSNGEPLLTTSQGTNTPATTTTTSGGDRARSTTQTTTPSTTSSTNCKHKSPRSMLGAGSNDQLLQELVMLEAINNELLQLLITQMTGNGNQLGQQGMNTTTNPLSLLTMGGTGGGLGGIGGSNGLSGISGPSNGSQMLQQMMGGGNRFSNMNSMGTNGMTGPQSSMSLGSSGSMGNSQMLQQMMSGNRSNSTNSFGMNGIPTGTNGMPTGMTGITGPQSMGMNSMNSPTSMSQGGSISQQQMMSMLMSKMRGKNTKSSGTTNSTRP